MDRRGRAKSFEGVRHGRSRAGGGRLFALQAPPEERLAGVRERIAELAAHVARIEHSALDVERREETLRDSRASLERLLRLGANDLDSRETELADRVREVEAREEQVAAEEAELERRRGELGAVELRRAALELRERALDEREVELIDRDDRLAAPAVRGPDHPRLAFVPGAAYELVELEDGPATAVGERLVIENVDYVVARIGPSPLPADSRLCAYLVRR